MIRPDDEDYPFIARWNSMMNILLVDPSIKGVGLAMGTHADWREGTRCYPSTERIAREARYTERAVRSALAILRGMNLADRVAYGVPHRRRGDQYTLTIPRNWSAMPILGPQGGKFTCLYCCRRFNPLSCVVASDSSDRQVWYSPWKACFCPPPKKRGGDGKLIRKDVDCMAEWNRDRLAEGKLPWNKLESQEAWKLFREARADDW